MKLPAFDYHAPRDVAECVRLKHEAGPSAVFLAGGQSLVPLLTQRRVRVEVVIDLNRVPELTAINGTRIGAMVRQRDAADSSVCPLLTDTIPFVGNAGTRNRGTIGGSVAYADPCGQIPAVALACDATATVVGGGGSRTVTAADLLTGPFQNSLGPDELLVDLVFPPAPSGAIAAWQEFRTREFDFPRIGVGVMLAEGFARAVATGVGARPVLMPEVANALIDGDLEGAVAATEAVEPSWEPGYVRSVLATLTRRALVEARGRLDDA